MTRLEKLKKTAKERPKRTLSAAFLLFFWLLTPLIAQKFYNFSAIHVSFAITVVYYIGMKLYKYS